MYGSQPGEYCCLYCGEYLFSEFPHGRTAEQPRLDRSAGRHRPRVRRTAAVA
jgi:hypothetical protein